MANTDLTAELLRALLHYDPETGIFTWLLPKSSKIKPGDRAGGKDIQSGYRSIWVVGKGRAEHRLAWLYVYGEWPKGDIDHINGISDDNRIANLRDASTSQNCQNQRKARISNSSGLLGVKKFRPGQWQSSIGVNGKYIHLGTFNSPESAHLAYIEAKRKYHSFGTL